MTCPTPRVRSLVAELLNLLANNRTDFFRFDIHNDVLPIKSDHYRSNYRTLVST